MQIATAEEMRGMDKGAIKEAGIPSLLLMERAAQGIVEEVLKAGGKCRAAVFSGPGNNGGPPSFGAGVCRPCLSGGRKGAHDWGQQPDGAASFRGRGLP